MSYPAPARLVEPRGSTLRCESCHAEHLVAFSFHMLFLNWVYVEPPDGSLRFYGVKASTSAELTGLNKHVAQRIGRFLQCRGLLERDAENSDLAGEPDRGPREQESAGPDRSSASDLSTVAGRGGVCRRLRRS